VDVVNVVDAKCDGSAGVDVLHDAVEVCHDYVVTSGEGARQRSVMQALMGREGGV
jgi:hypothetical protein